MPQLSSEKRRSLRDSAFAYVDSSGRRRLPIHDEAHVRNALARFNQVLFEDEAARDRARGRLLRAARRYGIVPVGFMEGQLRVTGARALPSGSVTFLMTDIVDSTGLLHELGDAYAALLTELRRHLRTIVRRAGGQEVDARADEYFAVFKRPAGALVAASAIHRALADHAWPQGATVHVRIGVHSGRPTLTDAGYVGIAVHAVNRICRVAGARQTVISGATLAALGDELPTGVTLRELGPHELRGVREASLLFEVSRVS
jgi:class 3 adenylate cyclase